MDSDDDLNFEFLLPKEYKDKEYKESQPLDFQTTVSPIDSKQDNDSFTFNFNSPEDNHGFQLNSPPTVFEGNEATDAVSPSFYGESTRDVLVTKNVYSFVLLLLTDFTPKTDHFDHQALLLSQETVSDDKDQAASMIPVQRDSSEQSKLFPCLSCHDYSINDYPLISVTGQSTAEPKTCLTRQVTESVTLCLRRKNDSLSVTQDSSLTASSGLTKKLKKVPTQRHETPEEGRGDASSSTASSGTGKFLQLYDQMMKKMEENEVEIKRRQQRLNETQDKLKSAREGYEIKVKKRMDLQTTLDKENKKNMTNKELLNEVKGLQQEVKSILTRVDPLTAIKAEKVLKKISKKRDKKLEKSKEEFDALLKELGNQLILKKKLVKEANEHLKDLKERSSEADKEIQEKRVETMNYKLESQRQFEEKETQLKDLIASYAMKIQEKQTELDELKSKREDQEKQAKELKEKIGVMREENSCIQERMDVLETQIQETRDRNEQMRGVNQSLVGKIKDTEASKIAVSLEVTERKDKIADLKTMIEDKDSKNSAEIQEIEKKLNSLTLTGHELKEKQENLDVQMKALEAKKQSLEQELEVRSNQNETLRQTEKSLRDEMNELHRKKAGLSLRLQTLKTAMKDKEDREESLTDLSLKKRQTEQEKERLQDELDAIESKLKDWKEKTVDHSSLVKELDEKTEELNDLMDEMTAKDAKHQTLLADEKKKLTDLEMTQKKMIQKEQNMTQKLKQERDLAKSLEYSFQQLSLRNQSLEKSLKEDEEAGPVKPVVSDLVTTFNSHTLRSSQSKTSRNTSREEWNSAAAFAPVTTSTRVRGGKASSQPVTSRRPSSQSRGQQTSSQVVPKKKKEQEKVFLPKFSIQEDEYDTEVDEEDQKKEDDQEEWF